MLESSPDPSLSTSDADRLRLVVETKQQATHSLTMVECGREYVLQWLGHAAYVTERFSGLLARQTLVDVTLICDEQKLRVHKLVLASCSLYFEEILAEDLGPEPVILLKDLEFNTLKAMVEFMYCGETTVSHTCLPSLLSAARLFKVKELESLVEKMVGSDSQNQSAKDAEHSAKKEERVNGVISTGDNGIRVSFNNKLVSNGHHRTSDTSETSESESEKNYLEENIFSSLSDSLNERCLYEEPFLDNHLNRSKNKSNKRASSREKRKTGELNGRPNHRAKSIESESDPSTLDSEHEEKISEPNLFQTFCDRKGNGCEKGGKIPRECPSPECLIEVNRVGQCSRVYTRKRRKMNGDMTSPKRLISKITPQPLTSARIDLIDQSSNDEIPYTLKTSLRNCSDCLLNFSTESIQSIVGCSLSDYCSSNTFEFLSSRLHLNLDYVDEEDSEEAEEEEEEDDMPKTLRRSERLNQQETEEPYTTKTRTKLRDDEKGRTSAKMKLIPRAKRRIKDSERKVPNVKVILGSPSNKKNHSKALRKSTKLASSKNHVSKSEKEVVKPKTSTEKQTSPLMSMAQGEPLKTNTTASVNRALWGDMSDVNEVDEEFLEYSTSAEIPFAVGLLPLRAALERMQATLDHQPRKTRSSVTKLESSSLKRKHSPESTTKKQSCGEDVVEQNPSAVCHIQIRTSPPCSRKSSLSEGATSLEQAPVTDSP